jgi:hypothetical protein
MMTELDKQPGPIIASRLTETDHGAIRPDGQCRPGDPDDPFPSLLSQRYPDSLRNELLTGKFAVQAVVPG